MPAATRRSRSSSKETKLNARLGRTLYFSLQALRGEPVAAVSRELDASQHWPRERLLALQWERMSRMIRFAHETVPHYRRSWDAVGFRPDDLRSRDDWKRLPTLDKVTLQEKRGDLVSSRA